MQFHIPSVVHAVPAAMAPVLEVTGTELVTGVGETVTVDEVAEVGATAAVTDGVVVGVGVEVDDETGEEVVVGSLSTSANAPPATFLADEPPAVDEATGVDVVMGVDELTDV